MELTRRDAFISVLAGGSAAVVGTFRPIASLPNPSDKPTGLDDSQMRTLVATAEVVYPSEVSEIDSFINTYAGGLSESQQQAVAAVVDELDSRAREVHASEFATLSIGERDALLRRMGVDRVGSDAEGTIPEQIRYYVVNQLLYGLYTSPTGSRLLGIENPVGYPGGYESYQNAPGETS